jgi:hypothetical protein
VTIYQLKYQDSARMLRRVTQPPFIAGLLAQIQKTILDSPSNLYR